MGSLDARAGSGAGGPDARRPSGPLRAWVGAFLLTGAACSGTIEAGDEQTGGPQDRPAPAPKGADPAGPSLTVPAAPCRVTDAALAPTRVLRLSPIQYANTVAALAGIAVDPRTLPADGAVDSGVVAFDNDWSTAVLGERHAVAFREVAARAAEAIGRDLEKNQPCLFQAAPPGACVARLLDTVGANAFRRPLTADERTRFGGLFDRSAASWGGRTAVRMVVTVMLQAPQFLYRTELGDGAAAGRLRLSPYEIASQLSYLFTDGPPDAPLLAAAAAGRLADPAEVRAHAGRLVDGPGARAKVQDFFAQWLRTKELAEEGLTRSPTLFPDLPVGLANAMSEETATFVARTVFDDKGSLRDLFTAKHSFLDGTMAKLYGTPDRRTGTFDRTALPTGRMGVLSHASVLSASSHPDGTSPAVRGLLIRRALLCQPVPDPPPGVADAPEGKIVSADARATQREHWQFALRTAPECVACHERFVPLGLGLEQFDAVGRLRPSEFGKPLDTRVELAGAGSADGRYPSTLEAAARIVDGDEGRRCFATQLASHAFARVVPSDAQRCELDAMAQVLARENGTIRDVLLALAGLESFYVRRGGN